MSFLRSIRFPFFLVLVFACAFPVTGFARPVTVAVVGDSIANELGRGMQALFARSRDVHVIKRTKFSTGLVRTDYFNWNAALRQYLRRHRADKIVVVMGGNDRQNITAGRRKLHRFSRAWRRNYERRVARFMQILKRARAKVYWVGLPQVASRQMTRDYRILNSIYRREAKRHGFTYVSIWRTFANSKGAYSSFARVGGHLARVRKEDGLHFTDIGSRALAGYVARVMDLR
jgi:hypothetical protein